MRKNTKLPHASNSHCARAHKKADFLWKSAIIFCERAEVDGITVLADGTLKMLDLSPTGASTGESHRPDYYWENGETDATPA